MVEPKVVPIEGRIPFMSLLRRRHELDVQIGGILADAIGERLDAIDAHAPLTPNSEVDPEPISESKG